MLGAIFITWMLDAIGELLGFTFKKDCSSYEYDSVLLMLEKFTLLKKSGISEVLMSSAGLKLSVSLSPITFVIPISSAEFIVTVYSLISTSYQFTIAITL